MDKKPKKCKKGSTRSFTNPRQKAAQNLSELAEISETIDSEILRNRIDKINQMYNDDKIKKSMKLTKTGNSKNEQSKPDNHVSEFSQTRISRSEQSRLIGKRSSSIPVRTNFETNIPRVQPNMCQTTKRYNSVQRAQSIVSKPVQNVDPRVQPNMCQTTKRFNSLQRSQSIVSIPVEKNFDRVQPNMCQTTKRSNSVQRAQSIVSIPVQNVDPRVQPNMCQTTKRFNSLQRAQSIVSIPVEKNFDRVQPNMCQTTKRSNSVQCEQSVVSIPVRKNFDPRIQPNICQTTKPSNSVQRAQSRQKVDIDDQFSNAQIDQVENVLQQKKYKMIPLIDEISQFSISNRENPIIHQLPRRKSNVSSTPIQSSNLGYKNIQSDKSCDNLKKSANNSVFKLIAGRSKLVNNSTSKLKMSNVDESIGNKLQQSKDLNKLKTDLKKNPNNPVLKLMVGRGKRVNNLTPKEVDQIKIKPELNLQNISSIETSPDIQHSTNSKLNIYNIDKSLDNKLLKCDENLMSNVLGRGKQIKPEIKKFQNCSDINSESSQSLNEKSISETSVQESQPEKKPKFKFLRPSTIEKNDVPKSEKLPEISIKNVKILDSINAETEGEFNHVRNWFKTTDTPTLTKSSSSSSLSSLSYTDQDQPEINKSSTSYESNISDEETDELHESVLAVESLERLKRVDGLLNGNIKVKLVTTFDELPLNSLIQSNLGIKKITNLSRCQVFSIPVVLEKRNFVLVGLPKSKKTTSYVVPLLNNLLDEEYYSKLIDGNGPRGVILVPNEHRVRHVASLCSSYSGARLNIITTHGGGLELERKDDLANGCDLLISTPRCLLRLLKLKHVTNILRLCHIVFDSFDDLSSLFLDELLLMYGMITDLEKYRKTNSIMYQVQKVFVGQTWNYVLEEILLKVLKNPVLCITAHLEAAVYAKINPQLIITEKDDKIKKFSELIHKNDCTKTVVICNTANEVNKIRVFPSDIKLNIICAHEKMATSLIQDAKNSWMSNSDKSMLVCSDQVVMELGITNANWLIHYSIPDNKSLFSDRFCVLKEHFSDRLLNPNVGSATCKVHLLVDTENEIQFPELHRFIELFNSQKLSDLKDAVQKIKEAKEKNKIGVNFCDNLLQFGDCWKQEKCKKQHVIDLHRDQPCISQNEHILFKLICVHNATCFSARISATAENINITNTSEIKWKPFQSDYSHISLMMMKYFRDVEKRHLHGRPKVGDKIAAQKPGTVFFSRGQILAITERNDKFDPTEVLVWFMDDGPKIKMKVENIYELPQSVYKFPPQTVTLYIANLQPIDLDVNWSYVSTKIIKRYLNRCQIEHKSLFHIGKVELVIGSNVIIDDVCSYEKLETSQCYVTRLSIKNLMLKLGMALYSPKHVKSLKDICVKGCLFEPEVEVAVKKIESDKVSWAKKTKETWAHLLKDELFEVNITCIRTPSLFFVQIKKFRTMHDKLVIDLSKYLEKNASPLKWIKIGSLCTAKIEEEDKQWNRALVTKIFSDTFVQVLFLDLGYSMEKDVSELFIIPETFITRLPFQAIECQLYGIIPLSEWSKESSDFLRSISHNEDYLKSFYLKVWDIKLKACVTNGRHYSVMLARADNVHSFINNEMISNGFAQRNHLSKNYFDEDWSNEILSMHDDDDDDDDYLDLINLEEAELRCPDLFLEFIKKWDVCGVLKDDDDDDDDDYLPPPINADDNLPPPIDDQKCTNVSNISDESEDESKSSHSEDNIGKLIPAIKYLTPKVFWRDNEFNVWLKIMIPDVKVHEIRYNQNYLTFQAHIDEKIYFLAIDFFGPTKKSGFEYNIGGQYVKIKLEKMIKYHPWIRLTYLDLKYPNIKIDPEYKLNSFIKNKYYVEVIGTEKDSDDESDRQSDIDPDKQNESDNEFGTMSYAQEINEPICC